MVGDRHRPINNRPQLTKLPHMAMLLPSLMIAVGCRQDMHNQPKYKPLAASQFFDDGRSARPMLEGTVARGHMRLDPVRFTGKVGGLDVTEFPFPITRADIGRGQERFNIYCSPCHGRTGDGQGMIVKRGFRAAANYHTEKLRNAPVGHFFDVVTNGFGAMPSYASRVPVDDRWRIIAYIRALQYSEAASINDVPSDLRDAMDKAGATGVLPNGQPPPSLEANPTAPGPKGEQK
jgi:hypothetical protein